MLPLASALTSARTHGHRRTGESGGSASLGLTLTLGRPRGAPPKGPGIATPHIGDPEPNHRTHPAILLPPGPLGAPPFIQGGGTVRALQTPATFESPLRQNTWALASAGQHPHLGPPPRSLHSPRIGSAGLLGTNPNHRLAPKGPLPKGLVLKRLKLGTPETQRRTHPATPIYLGLYGRRHHSGRENAQGPLSPW